MFKVVRGADEASSRIHAVSDDWKGVQAQPRRFRVSEAPLPEGVRRVVPLQARSRVSFEADRGAVLHGTVRKVTPEGDAVVVSDEGYEYKGTAAMFATSPVEAPATPAKGARVAWRDGRGREFLGVVLRSEATLLEVMQDGGEVRTSGPPGAFAPSQAPLAKDEPSDMDAWQLEAFREGRRRPGAVQPPFRATVSHRGDRAFVAVGEGPDAPVGYSGGKAAQALAGRFADDARAWADGNGGHDLPDAAAAYLVYRGKWAPYGVFSSDFIARLLPPAPAP